MECATCGAQGELTPEHDVRWTDSTRSVISMDERRAHAIEIQQTAARHRPQADEIDRLAGEFADWDRRVTPGRANV